MIWEILRLKTRLLVNGLRSPGRLVATILLTLLAAAGTVALVAGAGALRGLDALTVSRVVIVAGTLLALGAFLVPLIAVRSDLLDPAAFRGYGFRRRFVGAALLITSLVGPAALFVPLALVPLVRSSGPGTAAVIAAAPLIVVTAVLGARLGVVLGAALRHHPTWSRLARLAAILLLGLGVLVLAAHLAPAVAALMPGRLWPVALGVVLALAPLRDPVITEVLGLAPFAGAWRAPLAVEAGDADAAAGAFLEAGMLIVALALLWAIAVRSAFASTRRIPRAKAARVPGWFRHLPSTPTGAVAARSFSYWTRDPRYRAVLVTLPLVVLGSVLATSIAGIPVAITALVPLPLVLLLLSWASLHNDVAFDSTAIWSHLAAHTRGSADRLGRMLPVLSLGAIIVAIGTPVTAWLHGDPLIAPAVLGVALAVLLGGAGVSSLVSARFPYAASRPGDRAFQQPQSPGNSGGGAQAGSFALVVLVAVPALAAAALWLTGAPGAWNWIALVVGLASGLAVLAIGVRAGGAIFDRRAPELLAFSMRN